jgi:hypothetical protein
MIPAATTRMTQNTAEHINEQIRRETEAQVTRTAAAGPAAIEQRLEELDREWDIERTLEANAAGAALVGLGLGTFVNRRWFLLPAVVAGFLLQHAVQGWCPPVPLFRRIGVRSQTEIDYERYSLKVLRGDFQQRPVADGRTDRAHVTRVLEAVQR